jgi:hypothetical protein
VSTKSRPKSFFPKSHKKTALRDRFAFKEEGSLKGTHSSNTRRSLGLFATNCLTLQSSIGALTLAQPEKALIPTMVSRIAPPHPLQEKERSSQVIFTIESIAPE